MLLCSFIRRLQSFLVLFLLCCYVSHFEVAGSGTVFFLSFGSWFVSILLCCYFGQKQWMLLSVPVLPEALNPELSCLLRAFGIEWPCFLFWCTFVRIEWLVFIPCWPLRIFACTSQTVHLIKVLGTGKWRHLVWGVQVNIWESCLSGEFKRVARHK